jgi:hypothetical protein
MGWDSFHKVYTRVQRLSPYQRATFVEIIPMLFLRRLIESADISVSITTRCPVK